MSKKYVSNKFGNDKVEDFIISPLDIKESVKGKSACLDHVASEHYKYASDNLYVLLSLVFNCMIAYGYLPSKFMHTLIIPIVKDQKGDITNGDNYWPIDITSVTSKIVEFIILDKFLEKLGNTCNQFGFKKGLSCDLYIFSLKQTIDYYKTQANPVCIC